MKVKIAAILIAVASAFVLNASPAHALGSNTVYNATNTDGPAADIGISYVDPYVYSYLLHPGYQSSNNVSCFKPYTDMHSIYGGKYYSGVVRCFASSGNSLTLYGGLT